jgi:hypothetical protein
VDTCLTAFGSNVNFHNLDNLKTPMENKFEIPKELYLFPYQESCEIKEAQFVWRKLLSAIEQTKGVHTMVVIPIVDEHQHELAIGVKLRLQEAITKERSKNTGYQFLVSKLEEHEDRDVLMC